MILVIDQNYDINDIVTANLAISREFYCYSSHSSELQYKTLIYIVIPVIDQNYNVNDAVTANIHVMIPVFDRNCDINDVVTANLAKSQEISGISSHSPELQYKTLIYIVIPVIDWDYNVNDAVTANIHVMIPATDQNFDINDFVTANLAKSQEISINSSHSPRFEYK
jgi:hypothetical protein